MGGNIEMSCMRGAAVLAKGVMALCGCNGGTL